MSYKLITDVLVVVVVTGLALYDVLPALSKAPGDTISEAVQNAIAHNIVILYALSVLLGHFALPRETAIMGQPESVYLLVFVAWMSFIAGLVLRAADITINSLAVGAIVILAGLLSGHLLWPMSPKSF